MNYPRAIDALDTATSTAANLLTALFDPLKTSVGVAERRAVALVKRGWLERQESQLRRASTEDGLQMEHVLLETAQIDPLSPQWQHLPAIDESTRGAYTALLANLADPEAVRREVHLARAVWRRNPRIFALRDDFLSEYLAARVEAENFSSDADANFADDLEVEDAQGLLAADGGLQAHRLKLGARMIRQTTSILFDLVKQHSAAAQHDLVDEVCEAFSQTCVRRFRRALEHDRDGRELLYQLLTVNPLQLKVGSLRGIDPDVEQRWDKYVAVAVDGKAYQQDLERLRSAIASSPSLFDGSAGGPRTFGELLNALKVSRETPPADAAAGNVSDEAFDMTASSGVIIITLRRAHYTREPEVRKIEQSLVELAQSGDQPRMVISFANVEHATSIFIGTLFSLNKVIKQRKGRLALCDMSEPLRQVLELTGVHRVITIYAGLPVAVERLQD